MKTLAIKVDGNRKEFCVKSVNLSKHNAVRDWQSVKVILNRLGQNSFTVSSPFDKNKKMA